MRCVRVKISLALLYICVSLCEGAPANAQGRSEEQKRKESVEIGEKCYEVWYERKEDLPLGVKLELFKNLRADRELSDQELECLLRTSDHLIDKQLTANWANRRGAARFLGDLGHMYAIPALIAVLRDSSDGSGVRADCVVGLSRIADDRVVAPLIDVLTDPDEDVAYLAHEKLREITRTDIPIPGKYWQAGKPESLERKLYQARWREWWEKFRDEVTPERTNAFYGATPWRIYKEEDFPLKDKPKNAPPPGRFPHDSLFPPSSKESPDGASPGADDNGDSQR